jgi:hypothetical protein
MRIMLMCGMHSWVFIIKNKFDVSGYQIIFSNQYNLNLLYITSLPESKNLPNHYRHSLSQDLANIFYRAILNILHFAGQMVSVTDIQLSHYNMKASIDKT